MRNYLIFYFLLSINVLQGQIDMVAFGSQAAVVTNMYNPAIPLKGELSFNLPGLNSYSVTAITPFAPSGIISEQDGGNFIDFGKIIPLLDERNAFSAKADTDPFYFSSHTKNLKGFISAGYGHYAEITANFSNTFLTYLAEGNDNFINEELDFSNEKLSGIHYQKAHLGYAHFINPKLNVGARVNVYGGFNSFEIENSSANVLTDGTSFPAYATEASLAFEARMGGMIAEHFDKGNSYEYSGDHVFGLGFGVGIDLGVQYLSLIHI